ncbi:MAG: hypothetical protein AAF806_08475 [Bacteroidota bacterium]
MDTFNHILLRGSLLTIGSFIILMGSWIIDPKVWGADIGVDRQYQNRVGGILTVLILFAVQFPIMTYAIIDYEQIKPELTFWVALLISYLIFQIFNLADLFIFDWLIYMKMKPAFMYPDYFPPADKLSKHAKDSMNGLVLGIFPALVSTCIWRFCF